MAVDHSGGMNDDTYIVHYDFSEIDYGTAIEEFRELLHDISNAGLEANVQPGPDKSLVIMVKAPRDLLKKAVFNSRIKDWLYGVTQQKPNGDSTSLTDISESENLRSMFHLVTWGRELGGAGIIPGVGKWQNVKSVYPLHNKAATRALLVKWSRQLILGVEDLDHIKDLFGEKVALYFAFIQTYFIALAFPSTTGILAWLYLPGYSLLYAIVTSLWCTVFLEYWKLKQVELSLRWSVKGVGALKVNRPQFLADKEYIDPITGEAQKHVSHWKHIARLLLQIPFILTAFTGLGALISAVFVIELFVSEVYDGPLKFYVEYLPTVLLAISLPFISNGFETLATMLTEYENHRTEDRHEMALTQKVFMLSSITKYLPILLTAFVYVPCGDIIVQSLEVVIRTFGVGLNGTMTIQQFSIDASRLRNEVVALVVTEQVLGFGEELILPIVKRKASKWYSNTIQGRRQLFQPTTPLDSPNSSSNEANFPTQARHEAELEKYNVQDDIQEMVIQFGYLALFSPVWPLIPVGFLINNWVELRSDFLKICIEHQRPAPIRADSIGPWIDSLTFLNWLGSITTAAIVYLFRSGVKGEDLRFGNLYALAATIFLSEHIFLAVRYVVRIALERIGSDSERKEAREEYLRRKRSLGNHGLHRSGEESGLDSKKDISGTGGTMSSWHGGVAEARNLEAGIRLIQGAADLKKKA